MKQVSRDIQRDGHMEMGTKLNGTFGQTTGGHCQLKHISDQQSLYASMR